MREIKFRYTYSDGKNFFHKVFILDEIEQGYPFDEICDSPLLKDYKIVARSQYTGLKDKNGVEIYEGDIVKFRGDDKYVKGVVEFKAGGYIVLDIEADDDFDEIYDIYDLNKISITFNSELEVIGNIYENPELIGVKNGN